MGISVLGMHGVTLTGNTATYTLVDGNAMLTWGKCPRVNVGVGSAESSTLQPGAQAYVVRDDADGCLVGEPSPQGLERIAVSSDGTELVGATSGRTFMPWGMKTPGPLIEDFWAADWDRVVEAFRELRRMGANTVRIRLQFHKYIDPPSPGNPSGTPNQATLSKLADLISLAEQTGLYVDLSGLRIDEDADTGTWYDQLDETHRWAAQEVFWHSIASTVKSSDALAWYDLMNEPQSPAQPTDRWCAGDGVVPCFAQYLTKDPAGRTQVQIARQWMTRMNNAIRTTAGDTQHLISVGLNGASGFQPSDVVDLENFGSFHHYPRRDDPDTPQDELQVGINLVKSKKPPGQPLVIDETFTLHAEAEDVKAFILGSRPEASGWLGHYFEKTPSELTPPANFAEAFHRKFFLIFVPLTFLNPSGTGALQP